MQSMPAGVTVVAVASNFGNGEGNGWKFLKVCLLLHARDVEKVEN